MKIKDYLKHKMLEDIYMGAKSLGSSDNKCKSDYVLTDGAKQNIETFNFPLYYC